jgi:hypothetical protein
MSALSFHATETQPSVGNIRAAAVLLSGWNVAAVPAVDSNHAVVKSITDV